jgi:hypothetical protein
MAPWARRTDTIQKAIVSALRQNGRYVVETFRLPEFVDIIVGYKGRWFLAELKAPKGKLTEAQEALLMHAPARVYVWRSAEEALRDTE